MGLHVYKHSPLLALHPCQSHEGKDFGIMNTPLQHLVLSSAFVTEIPPNFFSQFFLTVFDHGFYLFIYLFYYYCCLISMLVVIVPCDSAAIQAYLQH